MSRSNRPIECPATAPRRDPRGRARPRAADLRAAAEWCAVFGHWLEQHARHANDAEVPGARTVHFPDAGVLDSFMTGLRRLGPQLEAVANDVDDLGLGPVLAVIRGGQDAS